MASPIAITPRLGSARPTLDTLIANHAPRWMWPSQSPIGIAITSDTPIAAPESSSCWPVLSSRKLRLCPMKVIASPKVFIAPSPSGPTA